MLDTSRVGGAVGGMALVLVALLTAGAGLTVSMTRSGRGAGVGPAVALPTGVARRTAAWRLAGASIGLVLGAATAVSGGWGRGPLLAAPVFGLCVLAGVVVGETSVRGPSGPTRAAALETRRARDYLPLGLAVAVLAATAALLALLAATTATASPDSLGRAGRALLLRCSPVSWQSHGPWPGSFYSVPLAALVVTGLVVGMVALRAVVRRPRPGTDPGMAAADDATRKRAAGAITGACGIVIALPLAGACLVAAGALLSSSCGPAWRTLAGWGLLAILPATAALAGWSAGVLLAPAGSAAGRLPAR